MVVSHPFLRRQVTEYMVLLIVRSSHASSSHTRLWIGSSFSAAC
jgi:hypothetical protein